MIPRVVDISHHNKVSDLAETASAGIWGVIHKASQGSGYRDPDYNARRKLANDAGLLWGAYHFNDGSDIAKQVANFIAAAKPDDDTLMVLDFEDNPKSNMTIQQAVQFLRLLEQKIGRKAAIYSGNRLKENISKLGAADLDYLCGHNLWLCQYGQNAKLPAGFSSWWLWQYTGDGVGPTPHSIAGIIGNGIDLNTYAGDRQSLLSSWAGAAIARVSASVASVSTNSNNSNSSHSRISEIDDDSSSDDNEPAEPVNIQLVRKSYNLDTEILQTKLDRLGYHEVGLVDGKWGGKLRGAVTAFLNDRGQSPDGLATDDGWTSNEAKSKVTNEISQAIIDGWTRPIAPARANATAQDVAPKIESVRQGLWQRLGAKIAGWGAFGTAAVSGVSDNFSSVNDKISPIKSALASVPTSIWLLLIAGIAFAIWYSANRATQATVKDYNTGKIN